MSLKAFHLVFILASIALGVWFGIWCMGEYSFTESALTLGMGLLSFASSVGLSVYLGWFLKKSRGIGYIVLALGLFASSQASACPVCIGDPNSLFVKSANMAVIFMLGVVGVMLAAFAGLFILWSRRDKQQLMSLRA